jgi:hypothetical protein
VFHSIEGIYRDGKIELLESPTMQSGVRVIVTFLSPNEIDLTTRGIGQSQVEDLRSQLQSFAGDWDHPDMAAYDAL